MKKKGISLILATTMYLSAVEAGANIETIMAASSITSETEEIFKDYAMIGMGNTFGDPQKALQKNIEDIEKKISLLKKGAKNEKTKKDLKELEKKWAVLKADIKEKPTLEKGEKMHKEANGMFEAAQKVEVDFVGEATNPEEKIMETAGDGAANIQRIAALYMMKVWGTQNDSFEAELDNAMKNFKEKLEEVKKFPKNNDTIKSEIKKIEKDFMFFRMMKRSSKRFIPTLIYKKSNDIFESMHKIEKEYRTILSK